MKDKIKLKAVSVKNHVDRNRGKYVALTLTTVFVAINMRNAKHIDEFLTEKGIDPMEYWTPEFYEVA